MGIEFSDWHGLAAIYIENDFAKAAVALHGGHVLSYTPKGSKDLLWISGKSSFTNGKAIRGGIPVCWPWFGGAGQPAHGLARISNWIQTGHSETAEGETVLNLAFIPGFMDYAFLLANLKITVGKSLTVELKTSNNGEDDYQLSEALHTYFAVSEIEKVSVSGMDGTPFTNSLNQTECVQCGDITFTEETDRIYHTGKASRIIDPGFGRSILIEKTGSESTVVWNPWIEKSKRMSDFGDEEYHGMLCVETANAQKGTLLLKAGASHCLTAKITEIKD